MAEESSKNSGGSEQDAFSSEEEIKLLERRLALLREGLQPLAPQEQEMAPAPEAKEPVEPTFLGEGPGSAVPDPAITQQVPPQVSDDQNIQSVKIDDIRSYDGDKQLKALVEIAFDRSLKDAVDIARRLDDAYLLDEFHDVLVDDERLHKQLVESGKLEEV